VAKTKVSLTLDPSTVARVRELMGSTPLSELVQTALERFIDEELERRHISGYRSRPPSDQDRAWSEIDRDPAEIDDDVDWAALYGVTRPE
jgi:hypothetical protein